MIHQCGNIVYNEVQSAQVLLGYRIMNAGCCKVLLHPQWGSVRLWCSFLLVINVLILHLGCLSCICVGGWARRAAATDFGQAFAAHGWRGR